MKQARQDIQRKYRFGFVLTTAAGNMTRYLNLRKYSERDIEVECSWAPVSHYLDPDPLRHMPHFLRTRLIVNIQAQPVMSRMSQMDAIMFHAFEPYTLAALRNRFCRRPLIVWSQDNPPQPVSPDSIRYCADSHPSDRRSTLRFWLDRWCLRHTALCFPFSKWAGDRLIETCGVAPARVHAINVGLDLELWPYLPYPKKSLKSRPSILFVGGNFVRKGGDLLLDVYCRHFSELADLHLVTKEPPVQVPARVFVHTDLGPNDPRLRQLYANADLLVLPTRADVSSWVSMEAMATGRPVIATAIAGIPDIVKHGETGFLIKADDGQELQQTIQTLLASSSLRHQMGKAGRSRVECEFNAAVCVPRILNVMKQAVTASAGTNRFTSDRETRI